MAVHSPFYRELNLARVKDLLKRSYSYGTIVSIVRDETGVSITPTKLRNYVEVNELASKKMLVRNETMKFLTRKESLEKA